VGNARYVIPMARAAVAAGAHGLIVEVHPNPPEALSDGDQSLTLEAFEQMVREVTRVTRALHEVADTAYVHKS
ncbi:MAG: 3-deoxy-7-phosphoheptulonate synthase, partial [Alicyclobacillus sp.]|nr:3-deoxy-7-phosphoheptulonate synthase [Alicyclobacillus sp.]